MANSKAQNFIKALRDSNAFIGVSVNKKTGKTYPCIIVDDENSETGRAFVGRKAFLDRETGETTYDFAVTGEAKKVGVQNTEE